MKRSVWMILTAVLVLCAVCAVVYIVSGCGTARTGTVAAASVAAPVRPAAALPEPWLELPAAAPAADEDIRLVTHRAMMQGRLQRNYTCFYDSDTYVSYWVAYPLCRAHLSTGREEVWAYDEKVPVAEQTSVKKGYGASVPTRNYPNNFYARGHQIPNADRNAVPGMQAQTYFSTNMTPQIQNGMNGGLWAKLEEAVRNQTPENDTLYIVTGASFRAHEGEKVRTIVNKNDGKTLPVPTYYWKAVLKVRRTPEGLAEAMTIGFWVPHDDLKGRNYAEFATSVDSLEILTGFDLFVNLPDGIEEDAEGNAAWNRFCSFDSGRQ